MLGRTLILVGIDGWREKQIRLTGLADVDLVYHSVTKFQKKMRNIHYHHINIKGYSFQVVHKQDCQPIYHSKDHKSYLQLLNVLLNKY